MNNTYVFKAATEPADLERYFRFRYRMYSDSIQDVFLSRNKDGIDFDCFDLHSRHYVIYNGSDIVGCVRIVLPREEYIDKGVAAVAKKHSFDTGQDGSSPGSIHPYPFLSYEYVLPSHWQFYRQLQQVNEGIIEVSRLRLAPEHQGLRTSKFLIEASFALFILFAADRKHVVVDCFLKHASFYTRYGFAPIHSEPYTLFGQPNVTLCIPKNSFFLSPSNTDDARTTIRAMSEELKETGKIERVIGKARSTAAV